MRIFSTYLPLYIFRCLKSSLSDCHKKLNLNISMFLWTTKAFSKGPAFTKKDNKGNYLLLKTKISRLKTELNKIYSWPPFTNASLSNYSVQEIGS